MQILVSDANVLIDFDRVGLAEPFFALDFEIRVLDVLFKEELADRHSHLEELGLRLESLPADSMDRAQELIRTYGLPGRIDLLTLALAEHLACPLLTGDADLRKAAELERVEVHGSLWVAERMVDDGVTSIEILRRSFDEMKRIGRRLPWSQVDQFLESESSDGWVVEAERRDAEIDSGAVQALPGEEVMSRIQERHTDSATSDESDTG